MAFVFVQGGIVRAKAGFRVILQGFSVIVCSLLYKTNRFHVAVRLFSNRSHKTLKFGKNIAIASVPLFCFYHILTSSMIYHH